MRDFAADDRGPQSAFRAIIGWLYSRIAQKAEQVVAIMLGADAIQEPLIVAVPQGSIQEKIIQRLIQFGDLLLERLVLQLRAATSQNLLLSSLLGELRPSIRCAARPRPGSAS